MKHEYINISHFNLPSFGNFFSLNVDQPKKIQSQVVTYVCHFYFKRNRALANFILTGSQTEAHLEVLQYWLVIYIHVKMAPVGFNTQNFTLKFINSVTPESLGSNQIFFIVVLMYVCSANVACNWNEIYTFTFSRFLMFSTHASHVGLKYVCRMRIKLNAEAKQDLSTQRVNFANFELKCGLGCLSSYLWFRSVSYTAVLL